MVELESNILSFGDDLENPFTVLQVVADQWKVDEEKALIRKLGGKLQRIGQAWQDLTFNRPYKKAEALPPLQEEWSTLEGLSSLAPEARIVILTRFTTGLGVKEGRFTKTQIAVANRNETVKGFLHGIEPRPVKISLPTYITLLAILELSGYPNPVFDSLQHHIGRVYEAGQFTGARGEAVLPDFFRILNDWLPTIADQPRP